MSSKIDFKCEGCAELSPWRTPEVKIQVLSVSFLLINDTKYLGKHCTSEVIYSDKLRPLLNCSFKIPYKD